MSLGKITIGKKIYFVTGILILLFTIGMFWLYNGYSNQLYKCRQQQLISAIETAWGIMDHYSKLPDGMAEEDAKSAAESTIENLRFEGDIYFWIKNENFQFVLCNQLIADTCGCKDKQEVIGKTDFDFFPSQNSAIPARLFGLIHGKVGPHLKFVGLLTWS